MENLNKENFFNRMMEQNPIITKKFCAWIDEYKKSVEWKKLFNSDSNWQDANGKNAPAPKFHELPMDLQAGLLSRFFLELHNRVPPFNDVLHYYESAFKVNEKHFQNVN